MSAADFYFSNETKKVLILCQRKKGEYMVGVVVGQLEKLVHAIFPQNIPEVTYLAKSIDESSDHVDYDFILTDQKWDEENYAQSMDFVKTHKNAFELVICNTCPIILMHYKLIYDLLSEGGLLAFAAYPGVDKSEKIAKLIERVDDMNVYFTKLDHALPDVLLFEKIPLKDKKRKH